MGSILSDWCSVRDNLGGIHVSLSAWQTYLGIHRSYQAVYVGGGYDGLATSEVKYDEALEAEHLGDLMLVLARGPSAPLAEWRDWYGGDLVAQEEIRTTLSQVARVVSQVSLRPE